MKKEKMIKINENIHKLWNKKDVFYITLIIVVSFSVFLIPAIFGSFNKITKVILVDMGLILSILGTFFFYCKYRRINFLENSFSFPKARQVFLFVFLAIVVTFTGAFLVKVWTGLLGITDSGLSVLEKTMTNNILFDYLYLKIVIGILIPIVEEVYFRGLIFGFIRQSKGFWVSALISTLLFSLMHFSVAMIPFTILLGLSTAYAYEKIKSLVSPIIIHVAVNSFASTLLLLGLYG